MTVPYFAPTRLPRALLLLHLEKLWLSKCLLICTSIVKMGGKWLIQFFYFILKTQMLIQEFVCIYSLNMFVEAMNVSQRDAYYFCQVMQLCQLWQEQSCIQPSCHLHSPPFSPFLLGTMVFGASFNHIMLIYMWTHIFIYLFF